MTHLRKVIVSGTLGAVLEWFDFFIFASLSGLILGQLFFGPADPVAEVLLGFSALAVGYFARPIGGLIAGHLGDRIGRKRVLIITIWVMGASTVLMGVLPTYALVGTWATVGLVVLRLVQGIALGGEFGGSSLLIVEHSARTRKRGFYSAWSNAGASFGFLLSSALLAVITALVTPEQLAEWAWRIPFLVSAVLLLVAGYIRRRISEPPALKKATGDEAEQTHRIPILKLMRSHPKAVLIGLTIPLTMLTYYQIALVFVTPYATQFADYSASQVLTSITIAQVIYVAATLGWARLSDRWGRRPVMAVGVIGCPAWLFAFFALLDTGSFIALAIGVAVMLVGVGAMWGPLGAFLCELFSADVRYSGVSICYQIPGAIAGMVPLVTFAVLAASGTWLSVTLLCAAVSVIGLVGLLCARETALADLRT